MLRLAPWTANAGRASLRLLCARRLSYAPAEVFNEQEDSYSRLPIFSKQTAVVGARPRTHEPPAQVAETLASIQCPDGANLPNVMYLYDDKGSALFEAITKTPEYYLTDMELSILKANSDDIARFPDEPPMIKEDNSAYTRHFESSLIELGAGSGRKMRPILDATERISTSKLSRYIPVDCSAGALDENINDHNIDIERGLSVEPFLGTNDEALQTLCLESGRKTYLFLGSSLGNFLGSKGVHVGSSNLIQGFGHRRWLGRVFEYGLQILGA